MSWAAAIAGSVALTEQVGSAYIKNKKAKEIAKSNIRPQYTPSKEILQNADLAASRANTGLGDAALTLGKEQNDRNLSQSLDAILRAGGGVNQISDLYANNGDSMLKLAALDSNLQANNINSFMGANAAKGGENQSAWEINQFAPYNERAQLAAMLRLNSQQQLSQAGQAAQQGAANYLTATQSKDTVTQPSIGDTANANEVYGRDFKDTPSQRYIDMLLKGNQGDIRTYNTAWEQTG